MRAVAEQIQVPEILVHAVEGNVGSVDNLVGIVKTRHRGDTRIDDGYVDSETRVPGLPKGACSHDLIGDPIQRAAIGGPTRLEGAQLDLGVRCNSHNGWMGSEPICGRTGQVYDKTVDHR